MFIINNSASLFFVLSSSFPVISQQLPKTQGVEGYVYRISGNQMPSPDVKPKPPKGIKTTLYIFDLTNLSQVTRQNQSAFYSSVKTKLVKKIETDTNGYFKVNLPTGNYSLFTKKGALFYANTFDGDNNIAPVQVKPKKMTKVEVKMDYDASY
ncbi:MAG TPA: hypothetical protein VMI12_01615 [Puia sp.]|nr:hypothetical protein [Puia sp.]